MVSSLFHITSNFILRNSKLVGVIEPKTVTQDIYDRLETYHHFIKAPINETEKIFKGLKNVELFDLIKFIEKFYGGKFPWYVVNSIVACDQVNILQYILKKQYNEATWINELLRFACLKGQFKCAKFLTDWVVPSRFIFTCGIEGQNMELIKWLYKTFEINGTNAHMCLAIEKGNQELMEFLENEMKLHYPNNSIYIAYGDLKTLKFLRQKQVVPSNEILWNNRAISMACVKGNTSCVKFMVEELQINVPYQATTSAAQNGHLSLLKFLHSINAPIKASAITQAATNGHHRVLRYLLDDLKKTATPFAFERAIKNGRCKCLELLYTFQEHRKSPEILQIAIKSGFQSIFSIISRFDPQLKITDNHINLAKELGRYKLLRKYFH